MPTEIYSELDEIYGTEVEIEELSEKGYLETEYGSEISELRGEVEELREDIENLTELFFDFLESSVRPERDILQGDL